MCFQPCLKVQGLLSLPLEWMVAGWLLGVLEHQDRLFLLYRQESRVFHLCQGIQVHLKRRKRHPSHHHILTKITFLRC